MDKNPRKFLNDPKAPAPTLAHINWLTQMMYAQQTKITTLQNGHLSKEEAQKLYSAGALREHLLAGGKHALTIHGMLGIAAQPQLANIPITTGPAASIPTDLGTSDAGEIFVSQDNGHLFIWSGSGWSMLDGAGYGTFSTVQPVPHAFWVSVPAGGGTVSITRPDATGTTSVTFPAYTPPGSGYLLWVRI